VYPKPKGAEEEYAYEVEHAHHACHEARHMTTRLLLFAQVLFLARLLIWYLEAAVLGGDISRPIAIAGADPPLFLGRAGAPLVLDGAVSLIVQYRIHFATFLFIASISLPLIDFILVLAPISPVPLIDSILVLAPVYFFLFLVRGYQAGVGPSFINLVDFTELFQ